MKYQDMTISQLRKKADKLGVKFTAKTTEA